MTCLMNVSVNVSRLAGRIPTVLSIGLSRERCALFAQKEGDGVEVDHASFGRMQILTEGVARWIKALSLSIHILAQELGRFLREAQEFDAPAVAPFTEGGRFLCQ